MKLKSNAQQIQIECHVAPKRPQTKAKWTAPPTPPRLIANTLEMSNLADN